jgi:hypothetical protein
MMNGPYTHGLARTQEEDSNESHKLGATISGYRAPAQNPKTWIRDTTADTMQDRMPVFGTAGANSELPISTASRDFHGNRRISTAVDALATSPRLAGVSPIQLSMMFSIVARSSPRPLPPLTLALRAFSSSAAARQAVPIETKPLNKEFKIYRWVLILTLSTRLHVPFISLHLVESR